VRYRYRLHTGQSSRKPGFQEPAAPDSRTMVPHIERLGKNHLSLAPLVTSGEKLLAALEAFPAPRGRVGHGEVARAQAGNFQRTVL
jgi:hypothetical protein